MTGPRDDSIAAAGAPGPRPIGLSGRIARAFLHSPLTPLVTIAALILGIVALVATPREEEPQISVPMIDVGVALPGATPREVEQLVVRPLEHLMWSIPGVEHVYSSAFEGNALVTARFRVGEDQERSVVKVKAKLDAAADQLPPGASPPLVKPYSIDDVPILAMALWGSSTDPNTLRQLATRLDETIRPIPDVAETYIIGGEARQIQVTLDPVRLAANGLSPGAVAGALASANVELPAGEFSNGNAVYVVRAGAPLATAQDVEQVIVGMQAGRPITLKDVASVTDGYGEPDLYVSYAEAGRPPASAVTIAVAKRRGANAVDVADAVLRRVDDVRSQLLPPDVHVAVTRNYGATASEKARELMLHLAIATVSVTVLVALVLGWREALVVLVAVPVTLALTLFAAYAMGYSLNRITLFALIFSIGILVDDAIVVVENVYRHLLRGEPDPDAATVSGVDEVGNPTILATFTVIAAILPMAFVGGLMGPYMRPIPIGSSAAMIASLAVAFIVTPYVALRLLRDVGRHMRPASEGIGAPPRSTRIATRLRDLYTRVMHALMASRRRRYAFYGGLVGLLLVSAALVATGLVSVKMLPFDNKSEFQLILDLPAGTTLETSSALADEVAAYLRTVPEVRSTETYAGTAAPFNFNGLVRHYFLRRSANAADVQVGLVPKGERRRQSHAIALAVRPSIDSIAARYGARVKLAEIPPGPPVLSTLVAEVYAPTDSARLAAGAAVHTAFDETPGVVDVDWTVPAPEHQLTLRIDREQASAAGASAAQLAELVSLVEAGRTVGVLRDAGAREPVRIVPRLAIADRSSALSLAAVPVATTAGPAPLGRFVHIDSAIRDAPRYRKDLRPVLYVTGDVAGAIEAPVYAILRMNTRLDSVRVNGSPLARYNAHAPPTLGETALSWDGEWQITLEVFRDLGVAFAIVLLLIYLLVVGWFRSYRTPFVIMAPIPLTLIGILPAHALTGAFFTATLMIGMIALAGIIVRNSVLLVDFIERAQAEGEGLGAAVIEAGVVRFRPIALTAAAVVIGGFVMVLDPIFQGLAVALIGGAVVSTALTMMVVPLLYWELRKPAGGAAHAAVARVTKR